MAKVVRKEVKELLDKYRQRIASEFDVKTVKDFQSIHEQKLYSEEYRSFKKEYMSKKVSLYEQACNWSEKMMKLSPKKSERDKALKDIEVAHLNITPEGATSFALIGPFLFAILTSVIGYVIAALILPVPSLYPVVFSFMAAFALVFTFRTFPSYLAIQWRLKASNQMVLSIFYTVTYMRHTSNLEGAIRFASDHLSPPLSLDLKRVLWNVETQKFASVKESLDDYLETWRDWNPEFIDSFHLIESSLFETSESRRLNNLDKSLTVILEGTFEKMLHFAHNLASPINILNMLGIILPILGLVILPLVVSFLTGDTTSPLTLVMVIGSLYNIAIPLSVHYLGKKILAQRPTGYGQTDISESNPNLKQYKNIQIGFGNQTIGLNPLYLCVALGILFIGLAFLPLGLHAVGFKDFGFGGKDDAVPCGRQFCFLEYHLSKATDGPLAGKSLGPFGLGASLFSLFLTLGLGIPIGLYYKLRSKNVIKIRERNIKLETEFASALFQLGNRLGDGMPAEMAFGKVSSSMEGSVSGDFFQLVHQNITSLGMSVEKAIFDPKVGAVRYFPSNIIKSSMKVLVQSAKKGPRVAAQALVNISQYIKEMHKVNERLKDLLADSITSMQTQTKFLAPAIAGIVVGITSMVTAILSRLTQLLAEAGGSEASGGLGGITQIIGLGMPTYFFQMIVGLYVVQIIVILTILVNNIQNGDDHLQQEHLLGKNVIKGTMLYVFIAFVVMIAFNALASVVLSGISV